MDFKKYVINIAGRDVTFETGKLCGQANGSCLVRCGDTVVMVNVTMSAAPKPGIDFFPLSVEYQEKMYSVGKIPGGFKKKNGFKRSLEIYGEFSLYRQEYCGCVYSMNRLAQINK